jgi:hypothetical protein
VRTHRAPRLAIFAGAIDDDAVAFYQKFGFASLTGRPRETAITSIKPEVVHRHLRFG